MQARWGHSDHSIIASVPTQSRNVIFGSVKAFNCNGKIQNTYIILIDEVIGHLRERVACSNQVNCPLLTAKPPAGIKDYKPYQPGEDGVPSLPTSVKVIVFT